MKAGQALAYLALAAVFGLASGAAYVPVGVLPSASSSLFSKLPVSLADFVNHFQSALPGLPVQSFSNTSSITAGYYDGNRTAYSCANTNLTATSSGQAWAWAYGKGAVTNGISLCGKAVANAFTNTCGKGNAVAALSSAAEVCANAVAKIYVDSLAKVNSTGAASVCADACGSARATASATATAISSAIALAVTPCAGAASFVQSKAFATALIDVTANAYSNACAVAALNGTNYAYTQATGMTQAMAYGYARVLTQAMAKACACSKCGCNVPANYFSDLAVSNAVGSTTAGKYAVLSAVGNAAAMFCKGGSMQTCVQTIVDSLLNVYANVLTQLSTMAVSDNLGMSTSSITTVGTARSIAEAIGQSLSGAMSLNFENACGVAFSGMFTNSDISNLAEVLTKAASQSWAMPRPYNQSYTDPITLQPKTVLLIGSKQWTWSNLTNTVTNTPAGKTIAKALTLVKNNCKCKGNCWCGTGTKCSPFKTCPAYTSSPASIQPCTGYGCPTPKATPTPAPSPTPSDLYSGPSIPTPGILSNTYGSANAPYNVVGANTAPLG